MTTLPHFVQDDSGAVTVDWVALTMGILLMGMVAVYAIFGNGVRSLVGEANELLLASSDVDPGPAPNINQ